MLQRCFGSFFTCSADAPSRLLVYFIYPRTFVRANQVFICDASVCKQTKTLRISSRAERLLRYAKHSITTTTSISISSSSSSNNNSTTRSIYSTYICASHRIFLSFSAQSRVQNRIEKTFWNSCI